jgi:hypothetical protein
MSNGAAVAAQDSFTKDLHRYAQLRPGAKLKASIGNLGLFADVYLLSRGETSFLIYATLPSKRHHYPSRRLRTEKIATPQ